MFDKKAYLRAYHHANRAKLNAGRRARYWKNRRQILEKMRLYRLANLERISARNKARYAKNKPAVLARRARYYKLNRPRVLAQIKTYRKQNPEVVVRANTIRRTRVYGVGTPVTQLRRADAKVRVLRSQKILSCHYCAKKVSGRRAHIDHILPISRGGRHIARNLIPACSSCNLSKNNKILGVEWFPKVC